MNSMLSAIKNRRGGLLNDHEENAHQMPEESAPQSGGMNMKGLVEALSPEQKGELLKLLVSGGEQAQPGMKSGDVASIEKGGMGPGEESELAEMSGEGQESEDEIAEGMISSSDKMRSERGDKPRNLGERVKFDLAKKLKK